MDESLGFRAIKDDSYLTYSKIMLIFQKVMKGGIYYKITKKTRAKPQAKAKITKTE